MTVLELTKQLPVKPLVLPEPEREIEGGYAGDLLSWVMGNAPHGCAWLTIMTNRNVVAVAELLDMACVIIAEGCQVEPEILELAETRGVNLLSTSEGVFALSGAVGKLL